MAYTFARASSQSMVGDSAASTATPLTIFAMARPNVATSDGASKVYAGVCASTGTPANAWLLYEASNTNHAWTSSGATNAQSTLNTGLAISVWHAATGVYAANNSRQIYTNTASGAANATTVNPSGVNRTVIGAFFTGGTLGGFAFHDLAEVAIWNAALTAAEITSLTRGFRPRRIRPQSLVWYSPLVRQVQDIRGGVAITVNNAPTVSAHPRVY